MKHNHCNFSDKMIRAPQFFLSLFRAESPTTQQNQFLHFLSLKTTFCAFRSYQAFQAVSSWGFVPSNYFCMRLEFTSLGHGYSPAHWNARVTHEVQWIILVMEMCCRRYGACQSCFCSASLGQLELVFAAIPLEWTGAKYSLQHFES